MSYPYDKTYLEKIQESKDECHDIAVVYNALLDKYIKEHEHVSDFIDLSIKESFTLLGEAFELASPTLGGITDEYHFVGDVLDALLTPTPEDEP